MSDNPNTEVKTPAPRPWLDVLLDRRMLMCAATGFVRVAAVCGYATGPGLAALGRRVAHGHRLFYCGPVSLRFEVPLGACSGAIPSDSPRPTAQLDDRHSNRVDRTDRLPRILAACRCPDDDCRDLNCLALFSATQDIALDAFRREILHTDGELALGNSIHVQAYRISGLVPGTLGLILAGSISWELNFMIMAAFMSVGVALSLLVSEPETEALAPPSLWQATVIPFQEFFQRRALGPAMAVLAFMVFTNWGTTWLRPWLRLSIWTWV